MNIKTKFDINDTVYAMSYDRRSVETLKVDSIDIEVELSKCVNIFYKCKENVGRIEEENLFSNKDECIENYVNFLKK